jgi:hypothetical protein
MEQEPRPQNIEMLVEKFNIQWSLESDEARNTERLTRLNKNLVDIFKKPLKPKDSPRIVYGVLSKDFRIALGEKDLWSQKSVKDLNLKPVTYLAFKRTGIDPITKPKEIRAESGDGPNDINAINTFLFQNGIPEAEGEEFINKVKEKVRTEIWNRISNF